MCVCGGGGDIFFNLEFVWIVLVGRECVVIFPFKNDGVPTLSGGFPGRNESHERGYVIDYSITVTPLLDAPSRRTGCCSIHGRVPNPTRQELMGE